MKDKTLRKILCAILVCTSIISSIAITSYAEEITPFYNNVHRVQSDVSVSSTGVMTIFNSFSGSTSVFSKAVITTYIEKRVLGIFWNKVDVGQANDEWVDTIYTNVYSGSHNIQLESKGTYRVTVEYVIYGSNGSPDVITKEIEKSY